MTKEAQAGLENVAALILERQRLENWLATLDAKKDSTPESVYQRVRGDYAARLRTITEQLVARGTALKQHVEQLSVRFTQFEAEAKRLREVRAESELRMQVGELSVADWNVKARECDEGIARLTEAQAVARASIAQAREILTMVGGQANGVPTPGSSRTPSTPHRASRPVNVDQLKTVENSQRPTPGSSSGSLDEMEFLKSVVGGQPPQTSSDGTPMPNTIELESAPDLGESMLNRLKERTQGNSSLREDGDADSLLKGVGTPKPGNKTNPLAANVTESNPIVLKPQGGPERHKTLKCHECSTMNYPTEWYCERCGAELAAV
jgi:hypothetical protein